jgi:hypothetical protein
VRFNETSRNNMVMECKARLIHSFAFSLIYRALHRSNYAISNKKYISEKRITRLRKKAQIKALSTNLLEEIGRHQHLSLTG